MQPGKPSSDYESRLARVRAYIYEHLDDDLDFARLAEIACMSPYHWHRIYVALHGETIAATVRRLRLNRAALDLATTRAPLADVARRAGYDSVAAFTRAFRPAYGTTPAAYRREGGRMGLSRPGQEGNETMREIEIRNVQPLRLFGIEHTGPYPEIGRAFDELHFLAGRRKMYGPDRKLVAVYFDDSTVTPPHQQRSLAGLSAPEDAPAEAPPLIELRLAGGDYAVLRHLGPYAELGASYTYLLGKWLPNSGRETADRPCYEIYLNTPMDTAPKDLATDIYLPLAPMP